MIHNSSALENEATHSSGYGPSIFNLFLENHQRDVDHVAIFGRESSPITYRELMLLTKSFVDQLEDRKIVSGDSVAVALQPSAKFFATVLALMSRGLTVVLVDPALGPRTTAGLLQSINCRNVITSTRLKFVLRCLPSLRHLSIFSLNDGRIRREGKGEIIPLPPKSHDAIISFTTGSTGQIKMIRRDYRVLNAQHAIIRRYWTPKIGSRELNFFPVFGFHALCIGSTVILPRARLGAKGFADVIAKQIREDGVTRIAAPPSALRLLCEHLDRDQCAPFTSVEQYTTGGSVVTPGLCKAMARHFPNADGLAVYGNTEAEPIAVAKASEVASDESDFGYLLGRPVSEISCSIRPVPDLVVSSQEQLEPIGRLVVSGPHAAGGEVDTGDIVGFDKGGRLFLIGRLPDLLRNRVGFLVAPLPIERRLSRILMTGELALVQVGDRCTLYVEGSSARHVGSRKNEISSVLDEYSLSARVEGVSLLPRDSRQRSKIDRVALRGQRW